MFKNYEFKEVEEAIINLWKAKDIYNKAKQRNQGGTPYYFLQGPPYTSGKLHIGHAWNNSLKDMVLRYKRMKGFDVWDRAGYDMHGLPTEKKVMELHKMKFKSEIETFGVAKFNEECLKYSTEKAMQMNEDLFRLGIWMDYEDPYMPVKTEFMEGEWFLVKKAHEQGRLFEGDRTLTWCPSCATAMAKHECDYKTVEDTSVFLKFKVKGTKNEYLVIWTTTPWTIMFNLAIMVNPELEYVKVKVEEEQWIVSKALMNIFIQGVVGKKYEIIEEFFGEKLEGVEYEHPWFELLPFYKKLKEEHPKVHTVVLSSEYVTTDSGTGLVHCAPGCGPEDFEIGYRNNIPPFNIIDERGMFPEEAGPFAGRVARKDDALFIKDFEKAGMLVADNPVEHEYAHCERCGSPVVFRKTKQWFFKVEDLKEKMIDINRNTYWVPKAGQNAFNSWLENLRDNSISKQRYWGTPVPIWRCDKCANYEVIGNVAELKEKAGEVPKNIHKPWIDEVTYSCECGGTMKRVPDILDVWIDAGTASWSSLYYPQRKDLFEKFFPADFILEAKEQVRGWFNLLMVASVIALDRDCFKAVYMHGMITDIEGKKMSKSLGNVISPYEVIDKHGSDTLRYYMCETKPGQDVNFSWEDIKLKFKNLQVLWNVQNYLFDLTRTHKLTPEPVGLKDMDVEEKYIFSRVHSALKQVTEMHDAYLLNDITPVIESAFLALSREYIQFIRDKENKQLIVNTIHDCLFNVIKMLAPSTPLIAEAIYQNMKEEYGYEDESVHLLNWPEFDEAFINPELEEEMRVSREIMTEILAKREEFGVGVRWPLSKAEVHLKEPEKVKETKRLILQQTNIKHLDLKKGDFAVSLDTNITPELEQEGYARELGRRIQALRKKAGLKKNDRIKMTVETAYALEKKFQEELKEKVGADSLHFVHETKETSDFMDEADIKGKKFRFVLKK
ncbi:MAG: isoleucine--tRNA ligase [Candidatus Nanoarchaeia archaeon]